MNHLKEFTLLYVEDDAELREQFMRVFRSHFKEAYECRDGEEALRSYQRHSPDMILADINLPKISGLELIEQIRKEDSETPIVVLSAYSDQEKLLRAIKLGLSEYMIKPVPYKKLLETLEKSAAEHRAQKSIVTLESGYVWDNESRRLLFGKEPISLNKNETALIELLVGMRGKTVPFEQIEYRLWGDDFATDHRGTLTHLLKRLRKKLPEKLVESVYGEGYRVV